MTSSPIGRSVLRPSRLEGSPLTGASRLHGRGLAAADVPVPGVAGLRVGVVPTRLLPIASAAVRPLLALVAVGSSHRSHSWGCPFSVADFPMDRLTHRSEHRDEGARAPGRNRTQGEPAAVTPMAAEDGCREGHRCGLATGEPLSFVMISTTASAVSMYRSQSGGRVTAEGKTQ